MNSCLAHIPLTKLITKKMKKLALVFSIAALCSASCVAKDFLSTELPDQFMTFGARVGVNTSNRIIGKPNIAGYNVQGWGTGFDIGVTADLNLRDYISIQPGVFFESRSNTYTLINDLGSSAIFDDPLISTQAGTFNSYALTIPVLASLHLNITDNIRWNIDFGPYVSFMFDSKLKNKVNNNTHLTDGTPGEGVQFRQDAAPVDFGFKFGTGLRILDHYYVGAHYMAGATRAWKNVKTDFGSYSYGGHTKAWVFTIGYDF